MSRERYDSSFLSPTDLAVYTGASGLRVDLVVMNSAGALVSMKVLAAKRDGRWAFLFSLSKAKPLCPHNE